MAEFDKYLYLDSKIVGTAKQIIVFFEYGIFQRGTTLVLLKKYKHSSNRYIARLLEKAGIQYRFVTMGDIDKLDGGVIFYPFNAQSNTRTAANRKLKHIFVTHGESNKISSVKPIIRIYDHVATAGQAGIDRFLDNGIFDKHDIESGRLIKMGDTFIGRTGLSTQESGLPCIFYAPTWEGGIAQENYSSLEKPNSVYALLNLLADKYQTRCIVIRPHPNTGHRIKDYRLRLVQLIRKLAEEGFEVVVLKANLSLSLREKWAFRRHPVKLLDDFNEYSARFGLCDISAMETQMLNEDIPYYLYWNIDRHPCGLWHQEIYRPVAQSGHHYEYYWELNPDTVNGANLKKYIIDEKMTHYPAHEKINILLNKIQ